MPVLLAVLFVVGVYAIGICVGWSAGRGVRLLEAYAIRRLEAADTGERLTLDEIKAKYGL